MKDYKQLINPDSVPAHIAIIMDGNGRWAKKHSLPRLEGHRKGSDVVEPIADAALELGIKALTLYAFSTENWIRPDSEVAGLWTLLDIYFQMKLPTIMEKGIRIKHSGMLEKIPAATRRNIVNALEKTRKNNKLILNFCLNYGGRQEIVSAVNTWLENRRGNAKLRPDDIKKNLYTGDLPDVDLLIRTSGEYRISNFLLWQLAYTELVFLDVLWPDFRPRHLYKAIYLYQNRERRFGGI
ncbi:MAG TPA: isoprenyl transferase [Spirochaetota bacterium]|nr:isoprenyl transferase [Spirochaetota bacterium]HPI90732.1 isoprenyl transferase [Spirochaetota bacterium]HPR46364.1 isoprenyl transferase [Spirochaetota bacterium]